VVDAACVEAGIRRVDNPTQMADLLEGLLGERRMTGRRVAVLTDGGGHGAMAADALTMAGLDIPALQPGTRDLLRATLWASSTVANPVDLAGAGDRDPLSYARAVQALLDADEVDGVLMTGYFGGYSAEPGTLHDLELRAVEAIVASVRAQSKPLVVHTIYPGGPSAALLRSAGIPVHRDVDRAGAVLAGLVASLAGRPSKLVPGGRDLAPPARVLPVRSNATPVTEPSYDAAKALFSAAGVAFPAARTVGSRQELRDALAVTGLPVVLKALGSVHKSDAGGVVLGLADETTVLTAYDDLVGRLDPPAVSVETMADLSAGVEVIVGCVRDRTFGPVVMVGLGGVLAEVLADTACALAPVAADRARELLLSLRGSALLVGARGRPPVDLDALASVVSAVSVVAAEHPELAELEVNPVLARPSGALGLDARVVLG
jgi:acyl-CoA synthetase (NDP forming)